MATTNVAYSAKLPRHARLFKSVYLKSLRDYRGGILGWGLGLGLLMTIVITAVPSLVNTAEARQALVETAQSFKFFWEPVSVDTPGGYALWKYGSLLAFPAIWGLLAGSRMLRGEEERGSLDALLSLPRSRARVAFEKVAAFGTALLLMGLLIGVFTALGGAGVKDAGFSFGDALLLGLDVSLVAAVFAAIAIFVSQFTTEAGPAAGFTGALFGLTILLNSLRLVAPSTENLARISPVYYFGLSKPLVPSYGTNPGALLALAGMTVVFTLAGIGLFLARDVGASFRVLPSVGAVSSARARRLPVNDWTLRSVYARSLRVLAFPTLWWAISIGFFGAVFTALLPQMAKNLAALFQGSGFTNVVSALTGGGDVATNAGFLAIIFAELPLVFTIFALIQANNWASDEENGRYELVLATPESRWRLLLGRYAAFVTSLLIQAGVLLAAVLVTAATQNVALDAGHVVAAVAGILPIALVTGSVGYMLATWVSGGAVTGILGALLAASFAVELLGGILNWPDWTQKLSIFTLYGNPLVKGLDWGSTLALLAVAAVALGIATWRFARKDVGR
jgi:ABC-2 type transport system permease protein